MTKQVRDAGKENNGGVDGADGGASGRPPICLLP